MHIIILTDEATKKVISDKLDELIVTIKNKPDLAEQVKIFLNRAREDT